MAAIQELTANLSEFIYTIAREAPLSAKRRLPSKYFDLIKTDKSAKRFSIKSSMDQKREFLAYLGVEQFVIFADVNKLIRPDIREVLSKIDESDGPSQILKKLSEDNVFISSNREFCYALLHVAQWFNTSVYVQNLDIIRSAYNVNNWDKKLDHEAHKNNIAESEAMAKFIKFVYAVINTNDIAETITEVDSPTTQILLYLYQKKGYVSQEQISLDTGLTMRQVHMSIKRSVELMLVQRHPKDETKEYLITARGITNINGFIEKIIKLLDFNP